MVITTVFELSDRPENREPFYLTAKVVLLSRTGVATPSTAWNAGFAFTDTIDLLPFMSM